jgi:hypothetical protein
LVIVGADFSASAKATADLAEAQSARAGRSA